MPLVNTQHKLSWCCWEEKRPQRSPLPARCLLRLICLMGVILLQQLLKMKMFNHLLDLDGTFLQGIALKSPFSLPQAAETEEKPRCFCGATGLQVVLFQ